MQFTDLKNSSRAEKVKEPFGLSRNFIIATITSISAFSVIFQEKFQVGSQILMYIIEYYSACHIKYSQSEQTAQMKKLGWKWRLKNPSLIH